jgi:hypothetical protein
VVAVLGIGVGQELPDRRGGGAVQVVVLPAAAEAVELTGDLGGRSGQGAARPDDHDLGAVGIQRPEAVAAAGRAGRHTQRGVSPMRWDLEVATRTLVIAVGWSLLRPSRPGW